MGKMRELKANPPKKDCFLCKNVNNMVTVLSGDYKRKMILVKQHI